MRNPIRIAFFCFSFGLLASFQTLACSCPTVAGVSENVRWWSTTSAAVFSGEAIKLEKIKGTRELMATFVVEEFWKGALSTEVEVRTEISEAACGYPFRLGVTYLVFAAQQDDKLRTGLCSGSSQRYDPLGKEKIELLGTSKAPIEKKP